MIMIHDSHVRLLYGTHEAAGYPEKLVKKIIMNKMKKHGFSCAIDAIYNNSRLLVAIQWGRKEPPYSLTYAFQIGWFDDEHPVGLDVDSCDRKSVLFYNKTYEEVLKEVLQWIDTEIGGKNV